MPAPNSPPTASLIWRLSLRTENRAGAHVVTAAGRLGTLSAGELTRALVAATTQGHRRVVLDLRDVDYVSSAGLLALHSALGRVHDRGGSLLLTGICEPVRLAFELSGLLSEFTVSASVDEALASFGAAT